MTIEYEGLEYEVLDATDGPNGLVLTCVPVPPPLTDYTDFLWCPTCQSHQEHTVHDAGHERDSSHDWRRCNKCGIRR